MADLHKDSLFVLVKSLSTSEKRQFKVYVNRLGINVDAKFLLLFNELDKMSSYDETKIISKGISTKKQLSNLKAHLYKQILVSLRMNPSHQNNRIQIREQLDFATILYQKGLHRQALKILDKAKQISLKLDEKILAADIVALEKVVESQYITRSLKGRADELIRESNDLSTHNLYNTKLSNLSLKLYSTMLQNGYAQTKEDKAKILKIFTEGMSGIEIGQLHFGEMLWYFKAQVWKNLLLQEYRMAYKYARRWVELFYEHPEMIDNHPVWYIKGNTNLTKILFLTVDTDRLETWFDKFLERTSQGQFLYNENLQSLIFLYYYNTKMNLHFIKGDFTGGTKLSKELEVKMRKFYDKIDEHHFQILYLKMAALHFGAKQYKKVIEYCRMILEGTRVAVQEELLFHTRILTLMAMFESGIDDSYDDFANTTLKFTKKMKYGTLLHQYLAKFFLKLNDLFPQDIPEAFREFDQRLTKFGKDSFNRRTLLYIDIQSWAKAKVQNKDVVEIIKEKSRTLK